MGHFYYHYEMPLHAVILETLFPSLRFTAQNLQGEVLLPTFFFSSLPRSALSLLLDPWTHIQQSLQLLTQAENEYVALFISDCPQNTPGQGGNSPLLFLRSCLFSQLPGW